MHSSSYMTRRSRSRTPSRVSTPIVKSAPAKKAAKKKAPTTRGRSKTPTRITTSTPKPKSSPVKAAASTKKTPAKAASAKKTPSKKAATESARKRKNLDFSELDDDIDSYVPKKRTKSPATASKGTGKAKKSPKSSEAGSSGSGTVRRSRRNRDTSLKSIAEESLTSKGSLKDVSINGGLNQSQNETLNQTQQAGKWGWFNCAIM